MQKTRLLFSTAPGGIKTSIDGELIVSTEDSMDGDVEVEHAMSDRRDAQRKPKR